YIRVRAAGGEPGLLEGCVVKGRLTESLTLAHPHEIEAGLIMLQVKYVAELMQGGEKGFRRELVVGALGSNLSRENRASVSRSLQKQRCAVRVIAGHETPVEHDAERPWQPGITVRQQHADTL